MSNNTDEGRIQINIEGDPGDINETTGRAIIAAVAEHVGQPVDLVAGDGTKVGSHDDEPEWAGEEVEMTDREKDLRDDIAEIMKGGPERGHEKIDELGKVFVRDRLDMIFDEIQYEDGTFAAHGAEDKLAADGLITGVGTINGRKVFFSAHDYTVKAGSLGMMGTEKEIRMSERAVEVGAPFLRLIDSTGARLNADDMEPGDTHAGRYRGGKQFYNQCIHSGQVPQIGVLYGPDIAGSAYTPVFSDYLLMVEEISGMAIAAPRVVKEMTGEEIDMQSLGGPDVHAKHSGSCEVVVPDEETAAEEVRDLISYLPQTHDAQLPTTEPRKPENNPERLDEVIPEHPQKPYDVRKAIKHIVDGDSWFELHEKFAREMVTGFARMGGRPVGIVANQPARKAGAIYPDSSEKAAGFIWKCDAWGIPLIYLCDTPGFMIGSKVEKDGVLQKGRKFIYATSNAQVPKLSVLTRKAYGAGIYAMCGPSFAPDSTLALPSAELSVMGPDAIVSALFGDKLEDMEEEEREEFEAAAKAEYEKYVDIKKQASKMQVDELVPAGDLREQLERRLDVYKNKERDPVDRHHGTVFF